MDQQLIRDFETYANSFSTGYLKRWKATSMLIFLHQVPSIMEDEIRFLKYLRDSLEMEGFRSTDIELIMGWLYERKGALV